MFAFMVAGIAIAMGTYAARNPTFHETSSPAFHYDLPPLHLEGLQPLPPPVPIDLSHLVVPSAGLGSAAVPAVPDAELKLTFDEQSVRPASKGSFYVVGWVKNDASVPVHHAKVTGALKDGLGVEVATAFGFVDVDTLPPGERGAVQVLFVDAPAYKTRSFEVTGSQDRFPLARAEGLRVKAGPAHAAAISSMFEVDGRVYNDGTTDAEFVKVQSRAYDAKGDLLGVDFTYVEGTNLAAQRDARFHMWINPFSAPPARWEFVVTGRPDQKAK